MLATVGADQQFTGAGRGVQPLRIVRINRQMCEVALAKIAGAGQTESIMALTFGKPTLIMKTYKAPSLSASTRGSRAGDQVGGLPRTAFVLAFQYTLGRSSVQGPRIRGRCGQIDHLVGAGPVIVRFDHRPG